MTQSRKRGHFAQEFKIELLVLKGRVALKQHIFCRESNSLLSFSGWRSIVLDYHCKLKFVKTLIEVSLPVFSVLRNFDDVLHLRDLKW